LLWEVQHRLMLRGQIWSMRHEHKLTRSGKNWLTTLFSRDDRQLAPLLSDLDWYSAR
jgi:hypothetical protein